MHKRDYVRTMGAASHGLFLGDPRWARAAVTPPGAVPSVKLIRTGFSLRCAASAPARSPRRNAS